MKINFLKTACAFCCLGLAACQTGSESVQPLSEAEVLSFARFDSKVKIMDQSENSITYEYSDVRIDQVSVLATQYCQEMSGKRPFWTRLSFTKTMPAAQNLIAINKLAINRPASYIMV